MSHSLRGKHTIRFRIFSALHDIPDHFNSTCELILLQTTLDQVIVHIHLSYLGKEMPIKKLYGISEYVYHIRQLYMYFRIPYPYLHFRNCFILKTISVFWKRDSFFQCLSPNKVHMIPEMLHIRSLFYFSKHFSDFYKSTVPRQLNISLKRIYYKTKLFERQQN